jgi:hypothetical protein
MSEAKTPVGNFLKNVGNEIAVQANRAHRFETDVKASNIDKVNPDQEDINMTPFNQSKNRK